MTGTDAIMLGTLLRKKGPPQPVDDFPGVQIDDPRLAAVLSPEAQLLCLYEGTLHAEGPDLGPVTGSIVLVRRAKSTIAEMEP